jgi:hypothetical protein
MKSRMPGVIARELPGGSQIVLGFLNLILRRQMRHVTAGWGLRRGLWVHGVSNPLDYLRLTQDYTLDGRVEHIRCPMLVCSAENDDIGVTTDALYDALTCGKTRLAFLATQGAGEHCEVGARSLFNEKAFDWLDGVLGKAGFDQSAARPLR